MQLVIKDAAQGGFTLDDDLCMSLTSLLSGAVTTVGAPGGIQTTYNTPTLNVDNFEFKTTQANDETFGSNSTYGEYTLRFTPRYVGQANI